jgi:hypothetical protein
MYCVALDSAMKRKVWRLRPEASIVGDLPVAKSNQIADSKNAFSIRLALKMQIVSCVACKPHTTQSRDDIFKLLRRPVVDFKELIPPAY